MIARRFAGLLGTGLIFLLFSCQPSQDAGDAVPEPLRLAAIARLEKVAESPLKWEKVHAAEYLVKLDYSDLVNDVFREEERISGRETYYRIGIWRVLAQLEGKSADGERWVDSIASVYRDTSAADRVHAAEALAKLGRWPGYEPMESAGDSPDNPILEIFSRWAYASSSEEAWNEAVRQFLQTIRSREPSPRERKLAAYALKHLGVPATLWPALADIALAEPAGSEAQAYLLAAAWVTVPQDSLVSGRVSTIRNQLLDASEGGDKAAYSEMLLALAKKGVERDLPLLERMLWEERFPGFSHAETAGVQATAAYAILRIARRHTPSLAILDWVVIALYGGGMLGIGWFYARKNKTREDYLLGGRRMNPVAVGISLFATLLSTLSYLSYPGEMIKYGPVIFAGMFAFPFVYYAAGWWLIPRIMQMNVTSAYEILEQKLGLSVRMLATFMFLSLRFLWMATIIYVTIDVAFLAVVPLDRTYVPVIGTILMMVTIIYTAMGGVKAVVLTDVIQSVIFLGGAFLSILAVCIHFDSFTSWLPDQWPRYWSPPQLGFDTHERTTVGNAVLMLFVWYICTTGSDQMAIQRYLSTKDIHAARKSLRVSLYTNLLAKCLLGLVGLAMFAFFTNNQHLLADGRTLRQQSDILFPRFILLGLPAGLSGLVIAGLLAAAMSSLSSGLNSVSTVISEDILKRFRWKKKAAVSTDSLRQVKSLSYITGALTMILSIFIGNVQGNLFDIVVKVVNLFVGPLFVLFFMALFVPFATTRGAFAGGVAAIITAVSIAFFGAFGITVLWILPMSLLAGVLAGMLISAVERGLIRKPTE